LEKSGYKVTQSTISRDLRRLGAVRVISANRQAIYRLSSDEGSPIKTTSFSNLVLDIKANGTLVVIHTSPGSASLVARHLDHIRPGGILGTLAGDDTIFVALSANRDSKVAIKEIEASFRKNS
jgi:transcriptional regulator of arginine metabolism